MGAEETRIWLLEYVQRYQSWSLDSSGVGKALYLLAGVIFFLVGFYELYSKRVERMAKLPPGPFQWPKFGSLPQLMFLNWGRRTSSSSSSTTTTTTSLRSILERLVTQYGPLVFLHLGSQSFVLVSNGEMAREVLDVHDAEYYYRPRMTVAKYLGFEFNDIGFSTGKHHRLVRKLCATQLLSHESLNKYKDIRNEARATMINTVWKSASHGNVIEVRDLVLDFTTNVLCRMLMSRTHLDIANIGLGFKQETFNSLVQEIMEVVGKLDTSMFIPWMRWLDLEGRTVELKELNRRLVKYFKGVIEEHEKSLESDDRAHESNDILDVLLSLEGDDMLSDDAIMGILLDMVVGGTGPSSSSVEWALAELVCNPVILDKVQSELDQIVGRDCILKETDLPRLPYFQAVVKETLRLHPAIPLSLPHMNIVPFQLANYELPEMTSVIVNYEAIGRDSTVWQDPLEFKPERFLNVEISTHIKALEVLPFGYGRRACPGANLGLSLVQLALASLVQGFDWTPCAGQIPHDIDLIESSDFICFKAHKLQLVGTPRLADSVYQS